MWVRKLIIRETEVYTGCPTNYRTRIFFNNLTNNEGIATKFEADLSHCVRNVKEKNVLLFKFHCNILTGVRIINLLATEFYI
jgi:hypothetical protein